MEKDKDDGVLGCLFTLLLLFVLIASFALAFGVKLRARIGVENGATVIEFPH